MFSSYTFLAVFDPPPRLHEHALKVSLSSLYNRTTHTPEFESEIERRWTEAKAACERKSRGLLWNATKFRLHGVDNEGVLLLGLTDYKSYLGTHSQIPENGINWTSTDNLSMSLGNAMVVVTSDMHVPFLRRSHQVAESEGIYALPGGHAEPSLLGLLQINQLDRLDTLPSESEVRTELYTSIIREVEEELGVQQDNLSVNDMAMLGISQRRFDYRPQLVGCIECNLSSSTILTLWRNNKDESSVESETVVFVSVSELKNVQSTGNLYGIPVGPEHIGAIHLFIQSTIYKEL